MKKFLSFIDYFAPQNSSPFLTRRARKLSFSYIALGGFLASFVLLDLSTNFEFTFSIVLKSLFSLILFSLPILHKYSEKYYACASIPIILAYISFPIIFSLYYQYEFNPDILIFSLVPMISTILLGRELGLASLLVFSLELLIINFLITFNSSSDIYSLPNALIYILFSTLLFFVSVLFDEMSSSYESIIKFSIDKANKANKAKDVFWSNISHELRTPLNGILGLSQLLHETNTNPKQKELLKIVRSCGEKLRNILNDVLDFTQLESGHFEVNKSPLQISTLLDNLEENNLEQAERKGIELMSFIDKEVPPGILSDYDRIYQILNNLISNSIKFTEKGNITLHVSVGKSKHEIIFTVIDTGIGIPKEKHELIFKSFGQVNVNANRKYDGIGIGLSISKKIAYLLGGDISFFSQRGIGSEFSLKIKAIPIKTSSTKRKVSPITSSLGDSIQVATQAEETTLEQVNQLKILLAEDNLVNQQVTVSMLKKFNYEVDIAENGVIAMEYLKNKRYDLVLMDLRMPEKDGYQTTLEIIETYGNYRPKIFAVTANFSDQDRSKCLSIGMDDFIAKPLRNEIIIPKIDRLQNEIYQTKIENHFDSWPEKTPDSNIDLNSFREHFAGDDELISQIIEQFKISSSEILIQLEKAISEGNYFKIEDYAHKYKGNVSSFYSAKMIKLALSLEESAKSQDIEQARDFLEQIKESHPKLLKELDNLKVDQDKAA